MSSRTFKEDREEINMSSPPPKLILLWHSVASWIHSGYGKTTYNILNRLIKYGYRVIQSAYYGMEPGGVLNYQGIVTVASKEGPFGVISAAKHAKRFKTDVQFLFTDAWAFSRFPELMPYPVVYSPFDHVYYPEEIINFIRKYRKIVTLCKFSHDDLLSRWNIDSTVIPHGVDLSIYKPLPKEECKKRLGLEGKFVFGTVAANSDKEDRKFHAGMMKAMRYFLDQNPDVKDIVWLYHTVPTDPRGMPLSNIAHKWKLDNVIKFMDPSMADIMLSEEELVTLYNAMDVHLLCSKREGFGLPIIESQACGVPNIVHNFSSMPELVKGHGWLVKSLGIDLNLTTTPINAETGVPDVYDLADKIKRAYFNDKERKRYARRSRQFALKFGYDDIVRDKWIPFLEEVKEDIRPKGVLERRIL